MDPAIHTEEYKGYKIEIYVDEVPSNPRKDFDPLGKIATWDRSIGEYDKRVDEDHIEEWIDELRNDNYIALVVSLHHYYRWEVETWDLPEEGYEIDSRANAFIYVSLRDVKKRWMDWPVNVDQVTDGLKAELAELCQYFNGEVYGYVVSTIENDAAPSEEVDSCWGFYGDWYPDDSALAAARESINCLVKDKESRSE